MVSPISLLILGLSVSCHAQSPKFWNDYAKNDIQKSANLQSLVKRAKNVIFFLGDGMGVSTVTSARILKSEFSRGFSTRTRPYTPLGFETWPNVGLSMTYNTDHMVADSAGTATAYMSGVKSRLGVIGVDDRVLWKNCSTYTPDTNLKSFLRIAAEEGKSVGLVTTTRITHATPAAAYAHAANRDWESDTDRNKDVSSELRSNCPDIASQMIDNAIDFRVLLGGGRSKFLLKTQTDHEGNVGSRSDEDLIAKWKRTMLSKGRRYRYIENGTDLRSLTPDKAEYVLGLFSSNHMEYEYNRRKNFRKQPSLEEMTTKAIEILKRNEKGFVLFVEAGRIDHGHHDNKAFLALFDTLAMDDAADKAASLVDISDTLMLATADHSHVFTFGGYASRQRSILDITDKDFGKGAGKGEDEKPFTSLLYANGPGAPINAPRPDLSGVNVMGAEYKQQALVPLVSETHGGEDVAIYAQGPMAHLIRGVHEQNYIAHVVMYSLCTGSYKTEPHCKKNASNFVQMTPMISIFAIISLISNSLF